MCIVGPLGSGKSTLARTLAGRLSLRAIHMDQLFFEPGWKPRPKDQLAAMVEAEIAEDGWVFDGNQLRTLPMRLAKAGTLIWLDLPLRITFPRIVRRVVRHHGSVRPDMAAGCPERFDAEFLRWASTFSKHSRPRLKFAFEQFEGRKYHLGTSSDIRRCLEAHRCLETLRDLDK